MSFRSFIPDKIQNKTLAKGLDLLRGIQRKFRIAWKSSNRHTYENRIAVDRLLGSFGEQQKSSPLLERQNSYKDIAYGKSDMAYAGCEVIAVYNAILSMGDRADLNTLIADFEHDGMILSGRFGTAPYAIRDHLIRYGYDVKTEHNEDDYNALAASSDVCILMMYNDKRNIFNKIHTICITREKNHYTAHNTYGDGRVVGPYASVTELISDLNGGFAKGIVLFGISRREAEA
ncbi:MAG: hypothetical protein K6G12_01700 [Lachnospiraceae bacterium]|nr:hypothetical protein [Lachnospiraceae bacterium]